MNKRQIKNITDGHYRKLKNHIRQVINGFDVETIHHLRVEYKKLRAFLRMLSIVNNPHQPINYSKKLKRFYKISGSIRDLQLQQQRILERVRKEPKKPQAYLNLLQREIEKVKPELIEIYSEKPVSDCKKGTDVLLPENFSIDAFKNFVQQKWAAIYAIISSGQFSDDNIHVIRKILKDLFYNLKEYGGVEYEILSVNTWKGKNVEYFEALLNELGNFQDKCTSIALLKSYWINSMNAYNRELLEKIKKRWINDKIKMKQILIKKLKSDILTLNNEQ